MFGLGKSGSNHKQKGGKGLSVAEIKSAVIEKTSAAIMTVDRDLIITYLNEELAQAGRR
jgi:hypothetical protein